MRTQSARPAPSDAATDSMFLKACRTRASSPATSVLFFGSMPRMPATNTKSPARAPTLHVPVGAMAPAGDSSLTAFMGLVFRRAGLQRERVQHAAHLALER